MKEALDLYRPTLPVSYALLLLEILEERGVAREAALRDTGILPRVLREPDGRLTPMQWLHVIANAIQLTGDEGLGCEYGLRMRASAHGFLGYAAMTGKNVREALEAVVKYLRGRVRQCQLHLKEEGDYAVVELRELAPIPFPQLRKFVIESIMIANVRMGETILGEHNLDIELWFDWPEPPYHARYRDRLPRVRFSSPANQMRFPVEHLERRLLLADEPAHQLALTQVEREYAGVREEEDGDVAARARAELQLSLDGYPEFGELAARLAMSTRTLRRRLSAQQTSYQALLDEARLRDARHLLEASDLDVQTIASRIGFDDPANFTRAFKRWTGSTPRDVRLMATDVTKRRSDRT